MAEETAVPTRTKIIIQTEPETHEFIMEVFRRAQANGCIPAEELPYAAQAWVDLNRAQRVEVPLQQMPRPDITKDAPQEDPTKTRKTRVPGVPGALVTDAPGPPKNQTLHPVNVLPKRKR